MLTLSLETSDKIFLSQSDTIATVSGRLSNFRQADGYSKTCTGDANNIKENGIYFCNGNVANTPANYGHLIVACVNNNVGNQLFLNYSDGSLYTRKLADSWSAWKKVQTEESSSTDLTSQTTALGNFTLNSVTSYLHNGAEYLNVAFHQKSGSFPFDNRYSVCQLPSQYSGKTLIYVSTIGNTNANMSGYTVSALLPGFYRPQDRNVILDFNRGIVATGQTINALSVTFLVV